MAERADSYEERERDATRGRAETGRGRAGVRSTPGTSPLSEEAERTLELREERMVPRRELRRIGEIVVRKRVEEVPSEIEVEALRQEVEVERVSIGEQVDRREPPREEDGTLVVPVYEEKLVVSKQLILKEELRIRRRESSHIERFEDRLRKERVEIEDPDDTGAVYERYVPRQGS